jgi:hypothetical protein
VRRHRIDQPVGADFGRVIHLGLNAKPAVILPNHQRVAGEIAAAEALEREESVRHDDGNDRTIDVHGADSFQRHQFLEPDHVFIGCAARLGCGAPDAALVLAVIDREGHVGVAAVDREQHR